MIPIFTGLTNAYQESQVDSGSFPIEAETRSESVSQNNSVDTHSAKFFLAEWSAFKRFCSLWIQ